MKSGEENAGDDNSILPQHRADVAPPRNMSNTKFKFDAAFASIASPPADGSSSLSDEFATDFPPIEQLSIESETSSSDEEPKPISTANTVRPSGPQAVAGSADTTEAKDTATSTAEADEFSGLVEAVDADEIDGVPNETFGSSFSGFEEFEDSFKAAKSVETPESSDVAAASTPKGNNTDWDAIFSDFGDKNAARAPLSSANDESTVPDGLNEAKLAQLTSMGFSKTQAEAALQKNPDDIAGATNYLLDQA
jgi:hypothetical protein